MKKNETVFLQILKAALRGEQYSTKEEIAMSDWYDILALAQIHNVLPLIYQSIYMFPEIKNDTEIKKQVRRLVMMQTMKTDEFFSLYHQFVNEGLEPIVVKGLICRNLYPTPDLRMSTDEDLLILEEQFEQCSEILERNGMKTSYKTDELYSAYEIPYHKENGMLYVELHKSLFPPESSAYGDLNRFFTKVQDRTIVIDGVHTLDHTDHLFYLICHAFKHFLHSGFGIRQVCDIVMFANAYGKEIDWSRVYHNCCEIHAEVFAAALFRIGEKYLTFDVEKADYPKEFRQIDVEETDMLQDLLGSGVFGGSTMSRKHSSNMTLDAVTADKQGNKAKMSLRNTLFPSIKSMKKRYPYLKKHPYLLPVAWADRILKYSREKKGASNNSAMDSLKIGSQRIELLRKYRVIE